MIKRNIVKLNTVGLALGLVAFVATPAALAAGTAAEGEKKSVVCQACHGADGTATQPIYPNLAGQHASYIERALEDYKTGKRNNPIMAGFATTLTAQDRADLAAYYATLPSKFVTLDLKEMSHD